MQHHFTKLLLAAAFTLSTDPLFAGVPPVSLDESKPDNSTITDWWSGKYASGNWFGVRDSLEERGITLEGKWRGNYLAIVDGGIERRGGFDEEINFDVGIDFAKLTGWSALEGLTFTGNTRWRDGRGITQYAGTDSTFRPSAFSGGQDWRLRKIYLTYTTPELFGVEDFLEISGGWQVPTDLFLVQPESKLFLNQTIRTAKGINLNGISWGGSFSTWGGYLQVKPVDWAYARGGLYLAYPFGTDENNHALSFQGYARDNRLNGVYSVNEIGFTPEIGPSRLPGKYTTGLIYWGVQNTGFDGQPYQGRLALYWQADQMLFRESTPDPEPEPLSEKSTGGKNFKDPVPTETSKPKLSKEGLYLFSTINYSPAANNPLPFYVLTGLVYKGLVPTRGEDQLGVSFALGSFSEDEQDRDFRLGRDTREYEAVLEATYRFQINRFAYVQPDIQYIINPGGRGLYGNATIIGAQFGVNF